MRGSPILLFIFLSGCAHRTEPFVEKERSEPETGAKEAIVEKAIQDAPRKEPANTFIETFDAGESLTDTVFSRVHLIGTGRFTMDRIEAHSGAPSDESLPVSAGGDRELCYSEGPDGIAGTHSMAVAPTTAGNVDSLVSGYMGTRLADKFGGRTAGLMCRSSGKGWAIDAYVARATFGSFGHNSVSFSLSAMKRGIIKAQNTSDRSEKFDLNFNEENVFIELHAAGDIITAQCW